MLSRAVRRAYGSVKATPMPVGAVPQLFLRSMGAHRPGILKDVTSVISSHGASITATEKIVLGEHYALMMYVWTPKKDQVEAIKAEIAAKFGPGECEITGLPDDAAAEYSAANKVPERRLVLQCTQRPGIIHAITDLISAQGCKIPQMETKVFNRDGVMHFRMDAVVQLANNNADAIEQQLLGVCAANTDLELTFDTSPAMRINLMEGV